MGPIGLGHRFQPTVFVPPGISLVDHNQLIARMQDILRHKTGSEPTEKTCWYILGPGMNIYVYIVLYIVEYTTL